MARTFSFISLITKLRTYLAQVLEPIEFRNKIFAHLALSPDTEIAFLDVGANIGQTTIKVYGALSDKVKFSAYCFEPFSENFQALTKNTANLSNIHCFNQGIGSAATKMTIQLAPQSQWHSISNQETWSTIDSKSEEIEIITLDSFVKERNIKSPIILKTDTEGYDLNVLHGAHSLLSNKEIDIIICEVGFNQEDKQHTYFPDIFDYLQSFGYRLYSIEEQATYRSHQWNNILSLGFANAWFISPRLNTIPPN